MHMWISVPGGPIASTVIHIWTIIGLSVGEPSLGLAAFRHPSMLLLRLPNTEVDSVDQ